MCSLWHKFTKFQLCEQFNPAFVFGWWLGLVLPILVFSFQYWCIVFILVVSFYYVIVVSY